MRSKNFAGIRENYELENYFLRNFHRAGSYLVSCMQNFSIKKGASTFRRTTLRRVHFVAITSSHDHFVAEYFVERHFVAMKKKTKQRTIYSRAEERVKN